MTLVETISHPPGLSFFSFPALVSIMAVILGFVVVYRFMKDNNKQQTRKTGRNKKVATIIQNVDFHVVIFYNRHAGGLSKYFVDEYNPTIHKSITLVQLDTEDTDAVLDGIVIDANTRVVVCGGDISFYKLFNIHCDEISLIV